MNHAAKVHAAASVRYQITVLGPDGRVAFALPPKRNLILDQGLDGIAARTWTASFTAAVVGTGTTPTKRDSGAITFSRAGSTVTASAGFFEAADVGRLLKFDTGEEVRITAFVDAQNVTTSTSGAIAAAEGTVWYVNQTGLATEVKRTSTFGTSAGECDSTFSAGTWTHKRTFIFSAEAGVVNYREIGWSHTTTPGNNLFGRDLLAGLGVTLAAGQQLKVSVELSVAYSPATSSAWTNVITGWSQDGAHGITASHVSFVNTNGTSGGGGGQELEPSSNQGRVILSSSSTAVAAMSSGVMTAVPSVIAAKALGAAAYASGSFSRTFSATFGVTEGNSASIRSIFLGFNTAGVEYGTYKVLLNANETKANTHNLSLTFTLTWGRVLNNA